MLSAMDTQAAGSWSAEADTGIVSGASRTIVTDASGDIWLFGRTTDNSICTHNQSGNSCAVYSKWNGLSWELPIRLGTGGLWQQDDYVHDIFLASNGYPCVAWKEQEGFIPFSQTLWRCWNGASWDPQKVIMSPMLFFAQFDVDSSGDVWMVYMTSLGTGLKTDVWDGVTWNSTGSDPNTTCSDANAFFANIVVDGSDTPWVVFECRNGSSSDIDLLSAKWNGSSWDSELGISTPDGKIDDFTAASLTLDGAGNPFVVWRAEDSAPNTDIYWSRWNGSTWTTEAPIGALDVYEDGWPTLATDSSGGVGATWTCSDGPTPSDDQEICYSYWNGSVWSTVEMVNLDDATWDQISHLMFDSADNPWITWNGFSSRLFTRWVPYYSPTVSATWTPTATVTPTLTNSETYTSTSTPTPTGTSTGTPTVTGTWTATPTDSSTSTASPTSTPSPTPTATPTASNTFTWSPTSTPTTTPSATLTWSGTITYSGTITPTTTRTLTYTPTPTYEDNAFFLDRNAFNPDKGEKVNIIAAAAIGGRYDLNVYNSAGELIRHLVKKTITQTGVIRANWDGKNEHGDVVSSGVYLIHVEAPKFARARRVAVIR